MQLPDELRGRDLSRREILAYFGMLGAGAALMNPVSAWARGTAGQRLVSEAASVKPHGSDLGAVEHIVYLMMENRSYDHYFGAYPKGRGFDDHPEHSLGVFAQQFPGKVGASVFLKHKLLPFHLDSKAGFECTDDLTHDWGPSTRAGTGERWISGSRSTRRRSGRGQTARRGCLVEGLQPAQRRRERQVRGAEELSDVRPGLL